MAIDTQAIEYWDEDTLLEGFFACSSSHDQPVPAVLIAHTWAGRDQFVCDKAKQIAALGYAGFAIDLYGKGILGQNAEENSKLMSPFMESRGKLQQRLKVALETLTSMAQVDERRVVALGYCFGGLCALDLARINAGIVGAVSFHGQLKSPGNRVSEPISAKVLALHGHDDPMIPPSTVAEFAAEMSAADADWQLHVYGGTAHSFTNPAANNPAMGAVYNKVADKRSWESACRFLTEIFKEGEMN